MNPVALQQEARAVADLKATLAASYGADAAEEEEAFILSIESETDFPTLCRAVVREIMNREAMEKAIADQIAVMSDRKKRIAEGADRLRDVLREALEAAGVSRLPLPEATLSLTKTPAKVIVTDEAQIPADFFEQPPPKLNKSLLMRALRDGASISGAILSNGGQSLAIRRG